MQNKNVVELSRWIRAYGHDSRHQERLLLMPFNWHQLWTALDVIDDVEWAIDAYQECEFPSSPGEQYLHIYGLLQALFVQGDAVEHFVSAIRPGVSIGAKDVFKAIREERNDAIGHPTKRGFKKGELSTHLISRTTMSKNGFDLVSFLDSNENASIRHVNIRELIEKQRAEVTRIMSEVVKELKKTDAEHRARFRTKKLAQAFHLVPYAFEKISEGLESTSAAPLAQWGADQLQSSLDAFEELLKERGVGLSTYDVIEYEYKQIRYPLGELRKFLVPEPSDIAHSEAARVYADALNESFSRLMRVANEIDEEYSGEKPDTPNNQASAHIEIAESETGVTDVHVTWEPVAQDKE